MSAELDLDDVAATSPKAMAELEALRAERDAECSRAMKAEARLRYYERALCVGPSQTWVRDEIEGQHAVRTIAPEKVTKVLDEREALRADVERLNSRTIRFGDTVYADVDLRVAIDDATRDAS